MMLETLTSTIILGKEGIDIEEEEEGINIHIQNSKGNTKMAKKKSIPIFWSDFQFGHQVFTTFI